MYQVPTAINANVSRRVIVHGTQQSQKPSAMPGVLRRSLERGEGGEVALATSIVDYAPGSRFSEHRHGGGEEFLVLQGVFSDGSGDFGPGSYVRNPPGSSHTPFSEQGCTIFVKLCQMRESDTQQLVCDSLQLTWQNTAAAGLTKKHLFTQPGYEQVHIERLESGARAQSPQPRNGEEILILTGSLFCDDILCEPLSWIRIPVGDAATLTAGVNGCVYWVKRGHLRHR